MRANLAQVLNVEPKQVRVLTDNHWPHPTLIEAGIKPPDDEHAPRVVEDEFA